MPAANESDRRMVASIASNARWAKVPDRTAATQPGRDGLTRRFEDEIDPDRLMSPVELAKRVESMRRAHFQRLALKSAQARRARKSA